METTSLSINGFGIDQVRKNINNYCEYLKKRFPYPVSVLELDDFDHLSFPFSNNSRLGTKFSINALKEDYINVNCNGRKVEIYFDETNKVAIVFTFNVNDRTNFHYVGVCQSNEFEKFSGDINSFLKNGKVFLWKQLHRFDGFNLTEMSYNFVNEFFAQKNTTVTS